MRFVRAYVCAAFAGLLLSGAAPARAGDLPAAEARLAVEDAFLTGRIEDVEEKLGLAVLPEATFVRRLRDEWRPGPGAASSGAAAVTSDAPELTLYPRLKALLADRERRETVGAAAVTVGGPLGAVGADPHVAWFLQWYATPAYRGLGRVDLDPEAASVIAEIRSTASRNLALGAGAVAALLILTFVLGLSTGVGGRLDAHQAGEESGGGARSDDTLGGS